MDLTYSTKPSKTSSKNKTTCHGYSYYSFGGKCKCGYTLIEKTERAFKLKIRLHNKYCKYNFKLDGWTDERDEYTNYFR